MNVLLLDDRLDNTRSEGYALRQALEARGHQVVGARSVPEAQMAVGNFPDGGNLDVAVIDLQLAPPDVPHVTGAAFARELRQCRGMDRVALVIFTINETPGAVEEKNKTGPQWGVWHLRQDTDTADCVHRIELWSAEWNGAMPEDEMPGGLVSSGG
ncbi:MAG TPA: hypothetical protein VEC99_00430 [Clostridia bacterium]|nr:hypothetical protein [Clostridia bacterium]